MRTSGSRGGREGRREEEKEIIVNEKYEFAHC